MVVLVGGGAVTVVSRVVVWVSSDRLAQETSIIPRTESAQPRIIDFFIIRIVFLFTNNSSQVASADVLKDKKFCPFASNATVRIGHECISVPPCSARIDLEMRLSHADSSDVDLCAPFL
jgi:hypothetical protein